MKAMASILVKLYPTVFTQQVKTVNLEKGWLLRTKLAFTMQLKYLLNWQQDILEKFYFDKLVWNTYTDISYFRRLSVQINNKLLLLWKFIVIRHKTNNITSYQNYLIYMIHVIFQSWIGSTVCQFTMMPTLFCILMAARLTG